MVRIISLLLLMLILPSAEAAWVTITGEANIVKGDVNAARQQAIKQALNMAVITNGGSISAQQTVTNGVLNQTAELTNNAAYTSLEIVKEQHKGNRIEVTIRVDLLTTLNESCLSNALKAPLYLPRAIVFDRQQLRYGKMEQFPQALSQKLAAILNQNSTKVYPKLDLSNSVPSHNFSNEHRGDSASWLNQQTNTLYILLAEVEDMALSESPSGVSAMWSKQQRDFRLKISLVHSISGEMIWQKEYQFTTDWDYDANASVKPISDAFWQSNYGGAIGNVLNQVSLDLDDTLGCRPAMAQVIAKQGQRVIFNLGRKSGVRTGDKFTIVLQHNFPDRVGQTRTIAKATAVQVTIDQITDDTSTALLAAIDDGTNIQINDIALKN
ncbi:flagellar assembly protein T N-terminal domain-containing protein [Shewanella avicenniae]|uniref:Flagellar assembly protein T N-terminal domain-containing protein n=1 Tax=Shewanella avicenniae TaxID=2814294 RepID=A0ABX7QMS9_9GAMM|nr:flagella assembly protein FlgT [Shewanella avicenniae]QSX32748.1 flagellar assembly protein T N-terminal domain-containing protein [Shewanella avicenniae]